MQLPLEEIRGTGLGGIDRDDEVFALRNLAKVLHWSGKFAEAIPLARDVLELAPSDAESRYIIACCLANLGLRDEALEEYDNLFADGIGYPRAYLPYGELLAASGQFEQAKAYFAASDLAKPRQRDHLRIPGTGAPGSWRNQVCRRSPSQSQRTTRKSRQGKVEITFCPLHLYPLIAGNSQRESSQRNDLTEGRDGTRRKIANLRVP